jgi:hypothetical protein
MMLCKELSVLLILSLATIAKLLGPNGAQTVVADSLLIKHKSGPDSRKSAIEI